MATLPDLDTSTTSFVAYWNAIDDGGVTGIDPEEVLTNGNVQEYTLYDNGVTVQYNGQNNRTFTVRVKEDGWFVALLDRTENTQLDQGSTPIPGPWDVIRNWTAPQNDGDIQNHTLERAINSLAGQLSNWDGITYNASDVGLYNYEYTSATTVTHLGSTEYGGDNGSPRFLYSDATTLHAAWSVGAAHGDYDSDAGTTNGYSEWEDGTTLCHASGDETRYGTMELLAAGLIPNSNTNYGNELTTQFKWSGSRESKSGASAKVLILWS